jgi:hypothetical protein
MTRGTRKLMGWGILAAVALVIVGVFLLSRMGTPNPAATASAATAAASQSVTASSQSAASSTEVADRTPQRAASTSVAVVEPDTMDQASRESFLTKLIRQGVFTGVDVTNSPAKVGATPLFLGLNPDLQRQFVATVFAYVNNGTTGKVPLEVIDARNGKVIGNYTAADGLKLL